MRHAIPTMAVVALLYVAFSLLSFALAHPELTQTQVLLRVGDAVTWRW